jgi:hypothetical protein
MNKLNRKIVQLRANFVKKLAKEIRPIGTSFTSRERKKMNVLYHKCAITAMQAKHEVSHLSVSRLNKLFYDLMKDAGIKRQPEGNCYNEKITMICFLKRVDREYLEATLRIMFENSPEFKER